MNDITWIILGVLAALTVVVTKLVIPYVKSKTSAADWAILDAKYRDWETDRKSTRLNSSHSAKSRMPSSA